MSDIARSLREREQAFEARFKLEEEQAFKHRARRDYLFGLEVGTMMGYKGQAAHDYALNLTKMDTQFPTDDTLLRRVSLDLTTKGHTPDLSVLTDLLDSMTHQAHRDLMNQSFPHG